MLFANRYEVLKPIPGTNTFRDIDDHKYIALSDDYENKIDIQSRQLLMSLEHGIDVGEKPFGTTLYKTNTDSYGGTHDVTNYRFRVFPLIQLDFSYEENGFKGRFKNLKTLVAKNKEEFNRLFNPYDVLTGVMFDSGRVFIACFSDGTPAKWGKKGIVAKRVFTSVKRYIMKQWGLQSDYDVYALSD